MDFVFNELKIIKDHALLREYKTIEGVQEPHIQIRGKSYLAFCSNNYLGLANHPEIKQAAVLAIHQYGWGAGASRLVSGNMAVHEELEEKIAEFKGAEAALLFSTGYMANLGTICAVVSKGDIVLGDKLNHASIIDGSRLSGAMFRVYPHNNLDQLEALLQRTSQYRRKLVVTDSLFSMDGDKAPLPEIAKLAQRYGAILMVDDAHATGIFGKQGRGLIEYFGLEGKVDILMGSLSKAIGSIGGYIAGKKSFIDYLKNKARPFMYTTALPPAVCAASLAGFKLIQKDSSFKEKLWENITYLEMRLSEKMKTISIESPVVPLLVGSAENALRLSESLYQNGILIPAIRPPTVPVNTSRLRLSLMATHSKENIDRLVDTLETIGFFSKKNT
ncbi:MAG: 8-amino-7-oxononanoate synthase [Candidatus Brocadiaceae bacterium]|nr:8-amino-7-oxononanoate synthase [Candidatus Brocadiaceae bacterium]